MNESFSFKRFVSLFAWSGTKKNLVLRIAIIILAIIQIGWIKSKSNLDSVQSMNTYIVASFFALNYMIFQTIAKQGVAHFLLLPATVFEKFLYIFTSIFGGAFAFSFLMSAMGELSSRLLFSVSHEWISFDSGFALWIVFTTSVLFFIQFVYLKRSVGNVSVILLSILIFTASIFADNYFIEHLAQYSLIRMLIYALLSVGFIGAAYLQFMKCEATFQTKTSVRK